VGGANKKKIVEKEKTREYNHLQQKLGKAWITVDNVRYHFYIFPR
jgi:hypothetical protein